MKLSSNNISKFDENWSKLEGVMAKCARWGKIACARAHARAHTYAQNIYDVKLCSNNISKKIFLYGKSFIFVKYDPGWMTPLLKPLHGG